MNKFDENSIIDLNKDQNDSMEAFENEGYEVERNSSKPAKKEREEKTSPLREALSWVFTFAAAIVLALILKNFVIINATVPTGSMENTIMPGDDLFGYRLAYQFSEPKRGDIVIFKYPDDEEEKYVKRIIGLPGETVTIVNAKVYINGSETPLDEAYLKEEWVVATGPFEYEIPADSYFVMGDNRNDSWDARYWENTFVHKDKIIGKAEFIYFPFDRAGVLE